MKTDGQLYGVLHRGQRECAAPPPGPEISLIKETKPRRAGRDELLILSIIFLILSDKNDTDLPLVMALIYILAA